MKINPQEKKKILYSAIGFFLLLLGMSALTQMDILTVLRGLVVVPLMTLLPGWIWTQNIPFLKKDLFIRIIYSVLISMFLTVITAFILRKFLFESMGDRLIIMAISTPVLIGIFFNFIIFIISKPRHGKKQ
ncbi:MAG: hypothetical protein WCW30_03495 [Candidatus Gracilibacteria bacterium]